jgi:hypothetical protein
MKATRFSKSVRSEAGTLLSDLDACQGGKRDIHSEMDSDPKP